MPKINEILLKQEGFQYAKLLHLNMGHYHIQIIDIKSNLCTIIILRGKYSYKRLPMGIENCPDIFRKKMNDLFYVFEFICAYIDESLV